ncbi:hypothetical protein GCM10007242_00850 [Pigmentiphaga litoralis]|nr:hypothetical protein GCM10007242_00850 [Pigmentiphaga litoralis]
MRLAVQRALMLDAGKAFSAASVNRHRSLMSMFIFMQQWTSTLRALLLTQHDPSRRPHDMSTPRLVRSTQSPVPQAALPRLLVALVLPLCLTLTACGGDDDSASNGGTPATSPAPQMKCAP